MKEKLKTFFTTNLWIKIGALLGGIVLWAILANAQDPSVTVNVSVPIVYMNEDLLLQNENLVLLEYPSTATVSVEVKNSKQALVRPEFFTCQADVTDHNGGDLKQQRVQIVVTQVGGENVILDWSYYRNSPNIQVAMDTTIAKVFPVTLRINGELSSDVQIGTFSLYPAEITVAGPEASFANVTKLCVSVDAEEIMAAEGNVFSKNLAIELVDANENVIPMTGSGLYVNADTVTATARISRSLQTTILWDGESEFQGQVKSGYRIASATFKPASVLLFREDDTPGSASEIILPKSIINVENRDASFDETIDLTPYLPAGTHIQGNDNNVKVTISIEKEMSKTISCQAADIDVLLDENYECTITDFEKSLTLIGLSKDVNRMTISSLQPTVDATGLGEGIHECKVTFANPENCTVEGADNVFVEVHITLIKEQEPAD